MDVAPHVVPCADENLPAQAVPTYFLMLHVPAQSIRAEPRDEFAEAYEKEKVAESPKRDTSIGECSYSRVSKYNRRPASLSSLQAIIIVPRMLRGPYL